MHVKQQVRDFVHDVKRKFSSKHNRDSTCSTCGIDGYDGASSYSSAETYGTTDDSSSSASSLPSTPRRKRLISFMHHHAPSSPPKEHNVLHKVKRVGSKRYRLFSAPSMPSMRADPVVESEPLIDGSVWEQAPTVDSSGTSGSSQEDYPDVMDISARSVNIHSVTPDSLFRDSASQSQPLFDTQSRSETSGTLFTAASTDFKKSISDSDSRIDFINLNSDENSASPVSSSPSITPMAQDDEVPPVPPKSDQADQAVTPTTAEEEEITLAQSTTTSPPVVSQVPRINEPAIPVRSTTASPAPVYLPRLTAPSMFLPIPNTDPLSALLTKYVSAEQRPRRDVVGEYAGRDMHEMVMSNSWRALARMARDRIVASDPEDLARILDLWSLRLSSLARLRLTNQASAECTNLFAVLNAVHPASAPGSFPGSGNLASSIPLPVSPAPGAPASLSPSGLSGLAQLPGTPSQKPSALPATTRHAHELSHPFELTVFHARVHYWAGDSLGYVDALSRILGRCKERAREEGRVIAQRRELKRAKSGGERRSEEMVWDKGANGVKENARVQDSGEEIETDEDEDTDGIKEDTEESGDAEERRDTETEEESPVDSETRDEDEQVDDVLAAAEANFSMWLERIARVCLILASQMVEMNDYQAAINLLTPLCTRRVAPSFLPTPSPELHSALARVYLLSGNLRKAEEHFSIATSAAANSSDIIATNTALSAAASGNWTRAEAALSEIIAKQPRNITAINNLAVILLCQGRINEGIELLQGVLDTSPSSVVVAEPFLFNLSTLYELRSAAAIDRKRELLIKVAQWSGDGLKASCLKMPSS